MSNKTIMLVAVGLIVAIILTGCSDVQEAVRGVNTVKVEVPVLHHSEAPAELQRTIFSQDDLPLFVEPTNPRATSALTADGEAKLRMIMIDREGTLDAWEKYGVSPVN